MSAKTPVRLVAIAGGSASGKTWLADQLQAVLGVQSSRLEQDHFYRDWSHLPPAERARVNFDDPAALDWAHFGLTLIELRAGEPSRRPIYDFHTHTRRSETVTAQPAPIVLVDGLWLLHRPEIRKLFDLRIFLHCPEEERLRRRLARDTLERGRTAEAVERQFRETVAPMHRQFVEPQARWADVVLHHPCAPEEVTALHEALLRLLHAEPARVPAPAPISFRTELNTLLQPISSLP